MVIERARVVQAAVEEAVGAIEEDGAHVLILGCTGMAGLANSIEEDLSRRGITDVPVLDPAVLALKVAEGLADMGLVHSKRSYPIPPEKKITGY